MMNTEIKNIVDKIRSTETMPELDDIREETYTAMVSGDQNTFELVQGEFRKAKNRLKRIPLRERTWYPKVRGGI